MMRWIICIMILTLLLSGCIEKRDEISEERFPEAGERGQVSEEEEATEDPFDDPTGPFYHDVYKATSLDSLEFEKNDKLILDKASVPDILQYSDGRLFIYVVDGSRQSESGLLVAISEDGGETWERNELQLTSAYRDFVNGADPDAVLLPDGRIRLYYIVHGGKPQQHSVVNSVLSAVSSDGVSFEEEAGSRFSYRDITDPDVIKIGETWFMYLAQGQRLLATTSIDSLSFSFNGTIREKGSVSNTVPINDTFWRQFYCINLGIKSAVSSDGKNWEDDEGFRIAPEQGKIFCDPAPVKVNDTWLLFYKVGPSGT